MKTTYELIVGVDNRRETYDCLEDVEKWTEKEGYYLLEPDFKPSEENIKYFIHQSDDAIYPIGVIKEIEEME